MIAPVRLGAVLAATARPDTWVLVGSAGLWCADCLVPGCGWTTTTATSEAATTAAAVHALGHSAATTAPTPTSWTRRTA